MIDNLNMSEDRNQTAETAAFRSLDTLYKRWKEGTFGEILEDWKWIFSYSKRYKGAIVFYTLLGIVSSSLALVAGVDICIGEVTSCRICGSYPGQKAPDQGADRQEKGQNTPF